MREWNLITKLDGIDIREHKIYQRERVVVPTAEKNVEHPPIKGRDESLTKKYGYKDIPFSMDFFYFEKGESFKKDFRKFKAKFLDAKTLIVNGDEEAFYKIKSMKIENAINDRDDIGEFTINFILDPFMYELDNEPITVTSRTLIKNDGHKALPIITAQVSGTGRIFINDQEITIQNVNGTITIDSEMKNAYRKSPTGLIAENMNKHMIGHFPVLQHGENVVEFDGDIERLEIIPNRRWV